MKIRNYLMVIAVSMIPILSSAKASDNIIRAELFFGVAKGNYLIGDLEGANRTIDEILRFSPDFLPAIELQMRILMDKGHAEAALQATNRAISISPHSEKYRLQKAITLHSLGIMEEATQIVDSVIEKVPEDDDTLIAATKLRKLLNDGASKWDTVSDILTPTYSGRSSSDTNKLNLPTNRLPQKEDNSTNQNESSEAIGILTEALQLWEAETGEEALRLRSKIRMMRAIAYTQNRDYENAINDLQFLRSGDPSNQEVAFTLASLFATMERWESLEGLLRTLHHDTNSYDIVYYLNGRIAFSKNRIGTARSNFDSSLDAISDGPSKLRASVLFYLARCFEKLGRFDEAYDRLSKALEYHFKPETRDEALFASRLLLRMDHADLAVPLLEEIILNKIDTSWDTWALLGRAQKKMGANTLAISAFNESLCQNPEQVDVLALRGEVLRKIGDLEGAAGDIKTAKAVSGNNAALSYSLALIRFQQIDIEKASILFEDAKELGLSKNETVLLLSSLSSYALNRNIAAKSTLQSYFELFGEAPNPTAIYLDYILSAVEDPSAALKKLKNIASKAHTTAEVGYYYGYCADIVDKKVLLDHLGHANTKESAQRQIAAGSFWMAQHEALNGNHYEFIELLKQSDEFGSMDQPEALAARWQLRKLAAHQ